MLPQVIFINDSSTPSPLRDLSPGGPLEKSAFEALPLGQVSLGHGLFRERRQLVRDYVLRLSTAKVFQHHLAEAGIRVDTPSADLHHGWEDPHCQLRGHFAGHWLSAVARFAALDRDPLAQARLAEAVALLQSCQARNGNGWAGSIPEKYLDLLERGHLIWSPQYTLHKTLAGLVDAAFVAGHAPAAEVLSRWTDWYVAWCRGLADRGRLDVVYQGECAGMLELWADLLGRTRDSRYLELARWYASPDLFVRLLNEPDALSHTHANATIPWIQGAARLYEVTGDVHFRTVVERFWDSAVAGRGMFATTGANAGEYWVPVQGFHQYLGARTQEHCTVYNMVRLAESLYRWTGRSTFADYIERALLNGILAQQHPKTGLVCYFLPLAPGSKKVWGTETEDFWCCHGTLVQAHTLAEELTYHRRGEGITVDQFVSSRFEADGVVLEQSVAPTPDRVGECLQTEIRVRSDRKGRWSLFVRRPGWLAGDPEFLVEGTAVQPELRGGHFVFDREWADQTLVCRFPKALRREALPGSTDRFALVDGPVVLAALTDGEVTGTGELRAEVAGEHQYAGGREWKSHTYWGAWGGRTFPLVPLYEVTDERYSVYFREVQP